MSYLISAFAFGLLFSALCGACIATVALALKWSGATALGIVFGVLVFALYVLYALRKQKKLRESAPVFDEKEALKKAEELAKQAAEREANPTTEDLLKQIVELLKK